MPKGKDEFSIVRKAQYIDLIHVPTAKVIVRIPIRDKPFNYGIGKSDANRAEIVCGILNKHSKEIIDEG